MAKKLTERAKRFCQEYVNNGFNGTLAYSTVFGQEKKTIASVSACNLLKDQRVKDEINNIEGDFRNIGFQHGLDKKAMVKTLAEMLNAEKIIVKNYDKVNKEYTYEKGPDWKVRFDAVMGFAKLTGDLTENKRIQIEDNNEEDESDVANMSEEELRKEREKILAEIKFDK